MGIHDHVRHPFGVSEMITCRVSRYGNRKTSRSTDLSVSSTNSLSSAGSSSGSRQPFEGITLNSNSVAAYKTQYCRSFKENGDCAYGGNCRFAHGDGELRIQEAQMHPKYKTEPCRNFQTKGHCHYGVNCQFIHEESSEELTHRRNFAFSHSQLLTSQENVEVKQLRERAAGFASLAVELNQVYSAGMKTLDIGLRQDPYLKLKWNKNVQPA